MSDNVNDTDSINKEEFLKALGAQIKKVREAKGLKAIEFAKLADMERSHVARLEAGGTNPTATTLQAVCKALDVEMEELFQGFRP